MPTACPVDENCLFCRIIAGELPCARVYEDGHVLAFLDINPIARGHTLVTPKAHYPTLFEFPAEHGAALLSAMRLTAHALREELGFGGLNVVQNNFAPAGQVIFHCHWHLIPRYENDGLADWPSGAYYTDNDDMRQLALAVMKRLETRA